MSVEELVEKLIDLGVRLDIDQGNLKVIGLQKKDAPAILPKLKEHKQALIEYTRSLQSNNASGELDFEMAPVQDFYPLSPAQHRLWVLGQMEGGAEAYNMPSTVYFDEEFDLPVLEKAINAVIDRHEILRTVFRVDPNRDPAQVILPKDETIFKLGYRNFESELNPEETARKHIESEAYRSFDLTQWPLIRAEVLRLDKDQFIFFYNMHHIISDGWSMDVLLNDAMAYYEAFMSKEPPDFEPLKIQYRDFAYTENKRLNSGEYETEQAFWKEELKGELPLITLPSILRRPDFKTYLGESFETKISSEMTKRLNRYCMEQGASLFTGLLAVWNTLMYRYTGERDIIIGTPVAGRDHPELEKQIGFYINMVPLRNELNGEMDFNSNFARIKKNTLNAFSNRKYPFDHIVTSVDTVFHPGRNAIFDIILSLQNTGEVSEDIIFEGSEIESLGVAAAKYDLEITFKEVGDFLSFNIISNIAVYSEETIRNLMQHFVKLLETLLHNPNQRLNELEFLLVNEKSRLIHAQRFEEEEIRYLTILDSFKELLEKTPNQVIARYNQEELTVIELDKRSDWLAAQLLSNGIEKGDFVPICFDRSLEMLVVILGVLKSGGAYVPLDASQPKERLDFIIEDTAAGVVITAKEFQDLFQNVEVICNLEEGKSDIQSELPLITIADRAYAIYTSGTTGKPKGVVNLHGALTNRLDWMRDELEIDAGDCLLQKTPYTFDVSVWELLMPLFTGAKLIFAKPEGHKETRYLEQLINREQVTIVHFVPSMLNVFLAELETNCTSLNYIVCSGEALPAKVAELCYKKLKATLYNFYGPTEAAIDVTYTVIPPNISVQDLITIGKPANNVRIYVLNEKDKIQPNGVIGEIVIAGIQVAEGYINRPELNQEAFIEDSFFNGEKAYRTGDLGWSLSNGEIVYVDRKDNQVKIRGNRIELEEIEHALLQKSTIEQVVVLAKADESGEKNLIAYLVSQAEQTTIDLRNHLLQKLPAYMVPTYFITLKEMPLIKNGKIDRKALPLPTELGMSNEVAFIAPKNEVEKQLVGIWENVLKKDKVGLKDNFFNLGGHSLKATQLVSQIYKIMNLEIHINDVFAYPVLEEQVTLLSKVSAVDYDQIEPVEEAESYRLSDGQFRLWVLSQFENGSAVYNMPNYLVLEGDYDSVNLERAILNTIQRHEILRTVFVETYKGVRQRIISANELGFNLEYLDFSTKDNPESDVEAYIEQDSYRPFDLEKGPLLRATLIHTAKQRFVFYYNLHHIISDGWSDRILMRDVMEYYESFSANKTIDLSPLRIQYKDFSAWQLKQIETGALRESQQYWFNRFEGELPILNFPSFKQRPVTRTHNGQLLHTYLDSSITTGLKAYAQKHGGTLFMVILASIKALLNRYTGQEDFIIGTPIAGRGNVDLEDQIGFYVNTLTLRNTVLNSESFNDLFERVRQTTLDAFTHQDYPFDRLVEDLNLKRDASRNPLFDVLLVLHNYDEKNPISLTEDQVNAIEDRGRSMTKFELEFAFEEQGDYLSMTLSYNPDVHNANIVEGFMRHYKMILKSLLNDPEKNIGELNVLTDIDKNVLLDEFSGDEQPYDDNLSLIQLFENQVRKTPDNIALQWDDNLISYNELNIISNQFANYLKDELNCNPRRLIGIKLTRNEWMIAAILGVLKQGSAYVPIDPEYPTERVEYIQKDSGCQLVIDDHEIKRFLAKCQTYDVNNLNLPQHSNDLAYVIYTSGSTGKPKGVAIENKNVVSFLSWCRHEFEREEYETVFGVTSICFDLSVFEIFHTLCTGKKLRLLNSALSITDYLEEEEKILINTVPSVMKTLLDEAIDFGRVTILNMAGEPLSNALVGRLRDKGLSVRNLYGPSESTTYSTVSKLDDEEKVTVGRPIKNTRVYLLNEMLQPQPIGVTGQICISGAGLARGYLNRPELTAEKFIKHPFIPEERLYLTGDLGRWLPDGRIMFEGRKDNQVKIRGYRIELGEVERSFETHSSIQQVIALANENGDGSSELVAYFTANSEQRTDELKCYLKNRLPNYMVPSALLQLEEFPLTPNGKVDKKVLSGMMTVEHIRNEFIAPSTAFEMRVMHVWQELLGIEQIGLDGDFYELGGHSIKLIQLTRKYESTFGKKIAIDRLFRHTRFREHVKILQENQSNYSFEPIIRLSEANVQQPLLFMVPPITGRAMLYASFSEQLKDEFNIYAFNYKGADFEQKTADSIENMAQDFSGEVLKMNLAENNVVTILGFSMGATIAYEMVRILEENKLSCRLILVDRAPNITPYFENIGEWSSVEKSAYAKEYLQGLFGEIPEQELHNYTNFLIHNMEILEAHHTRGKIKSGVNCIQAQGTYEVDAMSDWKAFTSGHFSLETLPLEHDEIFLPENIDYLRNLLTLKYENH